MNFSKQNLQQNLSQTLQQFFPDVMDEVELMKSIQILAEVTSLRSSIPYDFELIEKTMRACGFKQILNCGEEKKLPLLQAVSHFLLLNFFATHTLDYAVSFETVLSEHVSGDLRVQETKAEVDGFFGAACATGNLAGKVIAPGVPSLLPSTKNICTEKNYRIPPSLSKKHVSGDKRVDEFIHHSLVLNHYYALSQTKCHPFVKLQLQFLAQNLMARAESVCKIANNAKNTRFTVSGQRIYADYLSNFVYNNQRILDILTPKNLVPYMVELNGVAGVGKSSFVDLLAKSLHDVFPYLDKDQMVYSRVNDKFWNGYAQQPIVLFDDCNQNEKMLFNLDNEIISIGSGKFTYPPMAFEKDTRFSSLFVVFTTNDKLINTTHADKGAISRRLHTVCVEPKQQLGKYEVEDFGTKWIYRRGVRMSAFNLQFDGFGPTYIMSSFYDKMIKQIDDSVDSNIFSEHFLCEESVEEKTYIQEVYDVLQERKLDNWSRAQEKQRLAREAWEQEKERKIAATQTLIDLATKNVERFQRTTEEDEALLKQYKSIPSEQFVSSYDAELRRVAKDTTILSDNYFTANDNGFYQVFRDTTPQITLPEKQTVEVSKQPLMKTSEKIYLRQWTDNEGGRVTVLFLAREKVSGGYLYSASNDQLQSFGRVDKIFSSVIVRNQLETFITRYFDINAKSQALERLNTGVERLEKFQKELEKLQVTMSEIVDSKYRAQAQLLDA